MAKKTATPTTVTLKHLAAAIAEEQELSKKQAESILNDMVSRITKHLKKGERIRIVGLGILQVRKRSVSASCRCASGLPAWAAIPPPARRSTSRPARRLPSAQPRSSRKPSDKTPFFESVVFASFRAANAAPGMTLLPSPKFSALARF